MNHGKTIMKRACLLLPLFGGLLLLASAGTFASTIIFTQSATGSGTIGAESFDNAAFTVTAIGDTDNITTDGYLFFIDHASAAINIDGLGMFEIATPTRTFVNQDTQGAGFSRAGWSGADLFYAPYDAAFGAWEMLTSVGPITGAGALLQWSFEPVITDAGVLYFQTSEPQTTFQASVVPLPPALYFFVSGLLGLAGLYRRKAGA